MTANPIPERVATKVALPFAFRRAERKGCGFESVTLVVPCYNESGAIEKLHERLMPAVDELKTATRVQLVLVDDGSVDTTHEELGRHFGQVSGVRVDVARHEVNRGLTQALKTASGLATGEVVCTLDSDCTYDPAEIFGLLGLMERTGADIVTGSPYHPQGGVENVQGWRLALSKGASRMYGLVLPEKLYCYTSMFRAYRREWYRPEWLTGNGFLGVTEILAQAILAGAHVEEYPVVLHRRQYGESKMRVGRAMRDHLKLMGRLAVRSRR